MKKPTLNQILAAALLVAVAINSYQHYTHPAYKYYVDNINKLRDDFRLFKLQVANDFVPAVSNGFLSAAHASISNQISILTRQQPKTSHSLPSDKPKLPNFRFHHYFELDGRPYVMLGDWWYTVGDCLLGLPIEGISPDVVLIGGLYYDVQKN